MLSEEYKIYFCLSCGQEVNLRSKLLRTVANISSSLKP